MRWIISSGATTGGTVDPRPARSPDPTPAAADNVMATITAHQENVSPRPSGAVRTYAWSRREVAPARLLQQGRRGVTTVRANGTRSGRLAALLALVVVPVAAVGGATTGSADTRPPAGTPATVSADALPTVQIDGVVWAQAIAGTRVFAGGRFATARPAGARPGMRTVRRTDLLAYDIRTGALVTSFAPTLNGQVLAVAASPDGRRVYVAGDFTAVNGVRRNHVAAFDAATGALTSFAPSLDYRGRALAVTATRVYVGGSFSTANGVRRSRLAAFSTSGGLLSWAPAADGQVLAMVAAPGGRSVVVGGQFTHLAGRSAYGLGAVDATTGAGRAFAANAVVRDAAADAGITSLSTDGHLVFGTGYVFGATGNLEGAFAADPATGALRWVEDCHGDTYSAAPVAGVLYVVGHPHTCATVGGFPEASTRTFHRALAFTTAVHGTLAHNRVPHYADFGGRPAPALLTWFPDLTPGTATGQSQAAWSVAANASYVVLGGEFTAVNGHPQQGLVRFAVSRLAPNRQGPVGPASALALRATSTVPGQAALSWRSTWDRDNLRLTYTVRRDGAARPVYSRAFVYPFWRPSAIRGTDTGLTPGGRYTYRLTVTDPFGNSVGSAAVAVTIAR